MPKIASSRGGMVQIEVKGLAETARFIAEKGKIIEDGADKGTAKAANFYAQEVQESIIGKRAEVKSVDTGRFGNSITTDKIGFGVYKVFPRGSYPGGIRVGKVASMLEFGTARLPERRHFRNSMARNMKKIHDIINAEVSRQLRLVQTQAGRFINKILRSVPR